VWISKNHPNPPRQYTPPEDDGEPLAVFPRGDNHNRELRVRLKEFRGNPYISLVLWERGSGGTWWPVKGRSLSIRLREAEAFSDALWRAVELAPPEPRRSPPEPAREPAKPRPQPQPRSDQAVPTPPWEPRPDFNECEEN
jgi:hypothetical protein